MDATGDHSDLLIDESQPSQLIQNVLRGGVIGVGWNSNDLNHNPGDYNTSMDASVDSPAIRSTNSAPRYHYHGLAETQSQSQHHDVHENSHGSQKENISASNASGDMKIHSVPSTNARQHSPHISSSLGIHNKDLPSQGGQSSNTPLNATVMPKAMAAPTMPIPLQPSGATGSTSTIKTTISKEKLPTRFAPPPATRLSPIQDSSQDSFAGPISQDLEREFLANSKKFEIPLSELGRISYSQESQDTSLATDSGKPSSEHTEMFAFPGRGGGDKKKKNTPARPKPPADHGRVLVAATPSNSGSSQSQASQPSQQLAMSLDPEIYTNRQPTEVVYDEEIVNDDVDAHTEASTQEFGSEPSSSYERLLAGEPEPVEQLNNAATFEATQPSTQPEGQDDDDVLVEGENILTGQGAEWGTGSHEDIPSTSTNHGQQEPSDDPPAPSDNSSLVPRSIVSMVNPRKKWRINNREAKMPGPAVVQSEEDEERNVASETQPSFEGGDQESERHTAGVRQQARHEAAWPIRKQQLPSSNDNMEIVPDSEPPQSEQASHLINHPSDTRKRPLSAIQGGLPTAQTMDSADIILDSVVDDDDDDDTPLAALAVKQSPVKASSRGKAKAPASAGGRRPLKMVTSSPIGKKRKVGKKAFAPTKQNKEQNNKHRSNTPPMNIADAVIVEAQDAAAEPEKDMNPAGQSFETTVVPSSIPEQDLFGVIPVPEPIVRPKASKKNAKRKAKTEVKLVKAMSRTAPASDQQARSRSTSTNSMKKRCFDSDDSDGDSGSSYDEADLISKPKREEEEATELADEDYTVSDDDDSLRPPRKRKRVNGRADAKKAKKVPRIMTRATTKRSDTALSSTKRLRMTSSSPGTRVFALWRSDNHYYSGYVYSHVSGSKYVIKFDDGTDDEVDILRIRFNGLRFGDNVILRDKHEKAVVTDAERLESDEAIVVELHDGEELVRKKVFLSDIMIAVRTISSQWKDRTLTADTIDPKIHVRSLKNTPSVSKHSIASSGSARIVRSKALRKFGLAVTLTPGRKDWEEKKDRLITTIQNNGGMVIDDWFSIIRMDGTYSNGQKRWTMRAEQVRWAGKESLERIFLLADDASQKSKYLIALALGIPCLSIEWLYNFVNSGDPDWQQYLLPQGCSTALEARVSQFVDLDWCNSPEHLDKIMENKVASKVFKGKSILCLSPDFIPAKPGRNVSDADKSKEAWRAVPRIVIAMGADRVEAVVDVNLASKDMSDYDFVVLKDSSEFKRYLSDSTGVNCVSFQWVKECLIAGQLVPYLEW